MSLPAPVVEPRTAQEFVERITASWRQSVEAIFEVGRLLAAAKERLAHGEFTPMIENNLPFCSSTARRIMKVGADSRIANGAHGHVLPPSWRTLYELTKLDDEQLAARIADGTIRPDMQRADISTAVKQQRRTERERDLGAKQRALPDRKYGVILADAEWSFKVWGEGGMSRHAANHYPVSETETIAERDVGSIAADDCVLFMWATAPMLKQALKVIDAWGFEYKTHCIWDKIASGTGYWFINRHELLLVATRGNVVAPAPGTQCLSVMAVERAEHSRKPEWQYHVIEHYFPTLPKIELNARRARDGWDAWGLEAPQTEAAE